MIFTSDNGPWLNYGNHAGSTGGLREGKGTAFEGGPRVPAIMRWPGTIEPGSVCGRLASTIDILPTVAAVTGAARPRRPIDGVSILPLLQGDEDANPRNTFLYYYGGELRAVREGSWKRVYEHVTRSYVGVEPGHDGHPGPYASPAPRVPAALYDLRADVAETTDVAAAHPEIVARLDAIAEEARATLGDRLTGREGSEVRPLGRSRFDRPDRIDHAAVGAAVTLLTTPNPRYAGLGASVLTDGRVGSKDFADGRWLGFQDRDLDAVVDLGTRRVIQSIGLACMRHQRPWIFFPASIEFSVSDDADQWKVVGRVVPPVERSIEPAVRTFSVAVTAEAVRYVRVVGRRIDPLPDWHPGAGEPAWVFADEIIAEE